MKDSYWHPMVSRHYRLMNISIGTDISIKDNSWHQHEMASTFHAFSNGQFLLAAQRRPEADRQIYVRSYAKIPCTNGT